MTINIHIFWNIYFFISFSIVMLSFKILAPFLLSSSSLSSPHTITFIYYDDDHHDVIIAFYVVFSLFFFVKCALNSADIETDKNSTLKSNNMANIPNTKTQFEMCSLIIKAIGLKLQRTLSKCLQGSKPGCTSTQNMTTNAD